MPRIAADQPRQTKLGSDSHSREVLRARKGRRRKCESDPNFLPRPLRKVEVLPRAELMALPGAV